MKSNFKKKFFVILLLFNIFYIFQEKLYSQESAKYADTLVAEHQYNNQNIWGYGFYGGVLFNNHFVDFHALPNVPSCCPEYKTGFGINYSIGGFFTYKITTNYNIYAQLRGDFASIGGTIQAEERKLMFYSPTQSVLGKIEHTIQTNINTLALQPLLKIGLFENSFLHLGMSIRFLTSTSFEQKETLIEPKDLTFENGSKIRMNYGGKIPKVTSSLTGAVGGVNYEFPLNKNKSWFISPEFFLEYGFNNVIPDEKWNVLSYRMALAVNYRKTLEIIERFEQYERIDTIKIELPQIASRKVVLGVPFLDYDTVRVNNIFEITENYFRTDTLFLPPEYVMTASLKITALEDNGNEIQSPDIKVEEFLYNKMQPMLNYVFFDSNSYELPSRYHKLTKEKAKEFTLNKAFTKEELGFYHNILNIIGYKLKENKGTKITLIGHNNNIGAEKNNLKLSESRAQTIKDYLTSIWDIEPDRIKVVGHNLPEIPSNSRAIEGQEENRRVEIYSDNFRITSSLIARDTLLETTFYDKDDVKLRRLNFGGFRIHTNVTSDKEIDSWKVALVQGRDTLKVFRGKGDLPSYHDWTVKSTKNIGQILSKPIDVVLTATDITGKAVNIKESPNVEVKTIATKRQNREMDTKRDSYSMMLFEFASAKFTEDNKDFPNIIRRLLKPDTKVEVIGYSDSFGNDDFNMRLSAQRAQAVAKALNHPNTVSRGVGETILLYPNDTPEGRFYCRTVDIITQTPVHW